MGLATELAQSRYREVTAGGFRWHVEKPENGTLAEQGLAWVDLLPADLKREAVANGGEITPEMIRQLASKLNSANLRKMHEIDASVQRSLVCAGVVAVRRTEDDAWEDIRLVADRRQESTEAGRVWVESLDGATVSALASQIRDLLTEGVADRVGPFRAEARPRAAG